ncbi:beta-nerve growth factor isoform X2 [Odocoileus virginianus]|uniref:Beta-nerve growth factor n=1 Tax=Odocoileus virginianus TaxID=9874 RepID=A0ABM4I6A7_ODOVR
MRERGSLCWRASHGEQRSLRSWSSRSPDGWSEVPEATLAPAVAAPRCQRLARGVLAQGRAVQGAGWHAGPKLSSASGPNNGFSKGAAFCPGHTKAAPHTESNVPAGHAIPQAHWIKLQHSLDTVLRRAHSAPAGPIAARVAGQTHNITVDPKLFKKRRLRSPRVLFSTQPPPVAADTQDLDLEAGGAASFNRTHRSKRSSSHPVFHRGEFSVCDSVSVWVGDKTTATDIKGKEVMVLGEVNINNSVFKQYFFETKCREPNPVDGGCRGIDSKHWNSYCTTTHTFVKALTMDDKQAAWRFIRIDTACVCVLSRKAGRRA